MANVNAPFGGRLINTLVAASFNSKLHTYTTSSSDATPIFVGDFVRMTNVTDAYGTPYITQANATDLDIVGVAVSMKNPATQESRIYRAANEVLEIHVIDDPLAEFEMQVSGNVTTASIGKTANLLVGAGSTLTGMSAMQINVSTVGTGSQLLIIGMLARADNTLGTYAKVRITILAHKFLNKSATSGSIPVTNTFYVDGSRSDSYAADGSLLYPFKTIQGAVDKAASAIYTNMVSINIAPGTYAENVLFDSTNFRKIHLKGDSTQATILNPGFNDSIKCIGNNANFTDLVISDMYIHGDAIEMDGTSLFMLNGFRLNNCYIYCRADISNTNSVISLDSTWQDQITLVNTTGTFYNGIFLGTLIANTSSQFNIQDSNINGLVQIDASSTLVVQGNSISSLSVTSAGTMNSYNNYYGNLLSITGIGTCVSSGDRFDGGVDVALSASFTVKEIASSVSHAVTAHAGGGQANATHAYGKIVNVTVCASPGDSILLDNAYLNSWVIVKNSTSNVINVYPQPGEYMNGVLNAGSTTIGTATIYYSYENGKWQSMGI